MNNEILPTDRAVEERGEGSVAIGWPSWRLEPMASVLRMVRLVGPTDVTVLILGETGVGKEMVAQACTACRRGARGPSSRSTARPCRAICWRASCSATSAGPSRAPTGASSAASSRPTAGTIFLDEIGEMALPLQAKLLHVLQDGTFSRLGGNEEVSVDVRIVAATNRDLRRSSSAANSARISTIASAW